LTLWSEICSVTDLYHIICYKKTNTKILYNFIAICVGGVGLYITLKLVCKRRLGFESNTNNIQKLWIEVTLYNMKLVSNWNKIFAQAILYMDFKKY